MRADYFPGKDRVSIHVRNSVADEFPRDNDLIFGFEVACHIQDKDKLFDNIARNLRAGGHLPLADFVSHAGFEIGHDETSSYLAQKDKWVDLLSSRGMELGLAKVQVSRAVDIAIHVDRGINGRRFISEIVEVSGHEGDQILTQTIYAAEFHQCRLPR